MDYFKAGEWNVTCDLCSRPRKSSDVVLTWDKRYVCKEHKEVRNPQDFVRGVKDDRTVPFSRIPVVPVYQSGVNLITSTGAELITTSGANIIQ